MNNKRCKCKNPKPRQISNFEICMRCGKIIVSIRRLFHRPTKIVPNKKKYNRKKVNEELRKKY